MIERFLETCRRFVRSRPEFNAILPWFLKRYRILAVKPDTEIVIEGYPRCANTFSVVALIRSQESPPKIAHHLHGLGQVRRGLQRGIPCLILIREPKDAVLSMVIRKQLQRLDLPIEEYIAFYSGIQQVKDSVVIADFKEVITDFGIVIDRVNKRFGTDFNRFEHTQENVDACYEEIDQIERGHSRIDTVRATHVSRPSAEREKLKMALEDQLRAGRPLELLQKATAIYEDLTADLQSS